MLTLTRHEIHHAHKYPNLYSHTYLPDNTTLGAPETIKHAFKHTQTRTHLYREPCRQTHTHAHKHLMQRTTLMQRTMQPDSQTDKHTRAQVRVRLQFGQYFAGKRKNNTTLVYFSIFILQGSSALTNKHTNGHFTIEYDIMEKTQIAIRHALDNKGYNDRDTVRIQWGYSQDTVRIQWGYSKDTVGIQSGYSEDTARIQ